MSFPVSESTFHFEHDIASHKVWGEAGEHLESTGVQAIVIDAKIPFRNNIAQGATESWQPLPLYPDGMRDFVAAMYQRDTRILIHPEFGPILCKPVSCHIHFDPTKRDGCDVDAAWKQTMDDPEVQDPIFSSSSQDLDEATLTLDVSADSAADLAALQAELQLPEFALPWTELLRQVTGISDRVGVVSGKTFAPLNQLSHRAANLISSLDRAGTSVTSWPVKRAAYRIASGADKLSRKISGQGESGVNVYKVPTDTTMGALAGLLNVPAGVLLRLNTRLARATIVPAGSLVRHTGSAIVRGLF